MDGWTQANLLPVDLPTRVGWNLHPNTSLVSVRVGRSTTTREYPSHHATDGGVERYHSSIVIGLPSQRWMKVFHPYPSFILSDWTLLDETWSFTLLSASSSRGQASRHLPCLPVDEENSLRTCPCGQIQDANCAWAVCL